MYPNNTSYSPTLPPPPENCGHTSRIERNGTDFYITPGVINCFTCALDLVGELQWEIEMGEAATADFFMVLVFAMPDNYVVPGVSGRRNISCTSQNDGQKLQARLASPGKNKFKSLVINIHNHIYYFCSSGTATIP